GCLGGVFQVELDRSLVGVDRRETRRDTLPERRAPAPRVVTFRPLDLDDVRTEVREDFGGVRTRQVLAQLDDLDACQRQHRRATQRKSERAMTMRCTSDGPSPMRRTRASRYQRSSGNSFDTPYPPWICTAASITRPSTSLE